jgi:uncharacterized protein involved in response to NO
MYLLIQLGVIARVWAAIDMAGLRSSMLVTATLAWAAAFLLYVMVYGPYLVRARIDGRDG